MISLMKRAVLVSEAVAELQLKVGYHGGERRVAAPFTSTGKRSLNMGRSRLYGGYRVCRGAAGIVVTVDADRDFYRF